MSKFFLFLIAAVFFCVNISASYAKTLPQAKKSTTTSKRVTSTNLIISPKLRADRRALNVYFANLQSVSSVSYALFYKTNGQEEGAYGGISSSENSTSRQLLFGTCSKNVCRYHSNITDARLEISYTSSSGKKYLKKYKIKL